jgi:hypothetical protein
MKIHTLNERLFLLLKQHEREIERFLNPARIPLFYYLNNATTRPSILFVGYNPSFSEKFIQTICEEMHFNLNDFELRKHTRLETAVELSKKLEKKSREIPYAYFHQLEKFVKDIEEKVGDFGNITLLLLVMK